jgi:hypothetical protein
MYSSVWSIVTDSSIIYYERVIVYLITGFSLTGIVAHIYNDDDRDDGHDNYNYYKYY